MIKFRNIKANEIDLRVGSTNKEKTGFSLLLYKDARVDANILDETVSPENWQCKYYQVKNTMVCSVGININYADKNKEPLWIWKDDGGDDDYQAEKVKGELSDAFKRACFRWNIGRRNLYSSPFIWIKADAENTTSAHYSVKSIGYDKNDEINQLTIINDKTKKVVFSMGVSEKSASSEPKSANNGSVSAKEISKEVTQVEPSEDLKVIHNYYESLDDIKKEQFSAWLFNAVGKTEISQLSESDIKRVANVIKKVK